MKVKLKHSANSSTIVQKCTAGGIAFIAATACIAMMGYSSHIFEPSARFENSSSAENSLYQQLMNDIGSSTHATTILSNEKYASLIGEKHLELKAVLAIRSNISEGNFKKSLEQSKIQPLANATLYKGLQAALNELVEANDIRGQLEANRLDLEQAEITAAKQYLLYASQFADALGMHADSEQFSMQLKQLKTVEQLQQVEFNYYRSGVFSGLPVLQRLPDNLPNYLRVEQYLLDETRSEVIGQLVRSKSELRAYLPELQAKVRLMQEAHSSSSLHEDLQGLTTGYALASGYSANKQQVALQLTTQMIGEIVQPS